ncbi:MAG: transcriptional regulator [Planctomycetes bacterium]|nr:transcriptional regulator [Planctomycetota bacterium]
MKTTTRSLDFRRMPRDYAGLVRLFPPRPIHDKVDLENATEIIGALAGHNLTPDQEDYLDVLSDLVAKYEEAHSPVRRRRSTPLERLRYLVGEAGMTASDLGRMLGNRGLGSLILRGRRQLSKAHIRILAEHFRLDAGYFI